MLPIILNKMTKQNIKHEILCCKSITLTLTACSVDDRREYWNAMAKQPNRQNLMELYPL